MTARRLPLQKLFPNKVVFRLQVWFASWTMRSDGPIAPELAALIIACVTAGFGVKPATLARVVALTEELNGKRAPKSKPRTDLSTRSRLSKMRDQKLIGGKS